jgi:hypothetical protein
MPTVPAVVPAVKVTDVPEVEPMEPSLELVRAHRYVMPVGHVVVLHVEFAVKSAVPLEFTVGSIGLTDSEVRVGGTFVTVTTVEPCLVIPPSVALMKRPTVPVVVPAVNVVVAPLAGEIVPSVVLVRAHTYVMPEVGQVGVQVGLAVNVCVPPVATVGAAGLTATEERIAGITETNEWLPLVPL